MDEATRGRHRSLAATALASVVAFDGNAVSKKAKGPTKIVDPSVYGAPGEIRTPDHQVRSLVLYPAELRAQKLEAKL